jgi:hypothetical protein
LVVGLKARSLVGIFILLAALPSWTGVTAAGPGDEKARGVGADSPMAASIGRIDSTGPLTSIATNVRGVLDCAVYFRGSAIGEFYGGNACGTFLLAGGVRYGPSVPASTAGGTPFSLVSATATGQGTAARPYAMTTVATAGSAVRLTQVDTYVVGASGMRTTITIENLGDAAIDGVLWRAVDCYLAGIDYGYGHVEPTTGAVACAQDRTGASGRVIQFVPHTPGSMYTEAHYSTVWSQIASNRPFPGTCGCSTYQDNGAGLSWPLHVPARTSARFVHDLVFSAEGIPPPPAGPELFAIPESGRVRLEWNPASEEGVTAYRVYRASDGASDPVLVRTVKAPATSWTDRVPAGTSYRYAVRAVEGDIEGPDSNEVVGRAAAARQNLGHPLFTRAKPGEEPGRAEVEWSTPRMCSPGPRVTVPCDAPTGFHVYRALARNGPWRLVEEVEASGRRSYVFGEDEPRADSTLYYKVRIVGSEGEGPASAVVSTRAGLDGPSGTFFVHGVCSNDGMWLGTEPGWRVFFSRAAVGPVWAGTIDPLAEGLDSPDGMRRWLVERFIDFAESNQLGEGSVVLVGHSNGGLLIRSMLTDPYVAAHARRVVTLDSPDRGLDSFRAGTIKTFNSLCAPEWGWDTYIDTHLTRTGDVVPAWIANLAQGSDPLVVRALYIGCNTIGCQGSFTSLGGLGENAVWRDATLLATTTTDRPPASLLDIWRQSACATDADALAYIRHVPSSGNVYHSSGTAIHHRAILSLIADGTLDGLANQFACP